MLFVTKKMFNEKIILQLTGDRCVWPTPPRNRGDELKTFCLLVVIMAARVKAQLPSAAFRVFRIYYYIIAAYFEKTPIECCMNQSLDAEG